MDYLHFPLSGYGQDGLSLRKVECACGCGETFSPEDPTIIHDRKLNLLFSSEECQSDFYSEVKHMTEGEDE